MNETILLQHIKSIQSGWNDVPEDSRAEWVESVWVRLVAPLSIPWNRIQCVKHFKDLFLAVLQLSKFNFSQHLSPLEPADILNFTGLSGQGDRRIVVGLADDPTPVQARIEWLGGTAESLGPFAPDGYRRLEKATLAKTAKARGKK